MSKKSPVEDNYPADGVNFEDTTPNITHADGKNNINKEIQNRFEQLYLSMSEGVCIHKIIYNEDGTAVDYEIIDVNPAYETITGIKKEKATGSKGSELYKTSEAPFLDIYTKVAETGEPTTFEVFWPTMNKYFQINVFSPRKGEFATVFSDITERKKTENELIEEKSKLDAIMGALEYGILTLDREYNIKFMNQSLKEWFGAKEGEKCFKTIYGRDTRCQECQVEKAFTDGKSHTLERELLLPSGETKYTEDTANPIINEKGEAISCVEVIRDITDKKNSERALEESEARFKGIFDDATHGIAMVDPDGDFIIFNHRTAEMLGYTEDELKSMNLFEITHPEDIGVCKGKFNTLLSGGLNSYRIEKRYLKKDGSYLWADISVKPILKDGKIDSILGIIVDITDKKRAEYELERSASLHKATLESTGDGILVLDGDGNVLDFNEKFVEMWDFPDSIIENRDIEKGLEYIKEILVDPDVVIKRFSELIDKKDATLNEYFVEFKNGQVLRVYSQPIKSKEADFGRVFSFHDVTDRKQMEKTLIQLNEVLRLMNKNLRHDILNDLTIIDNNIELYKEIKDDKMLKNALKSVEKSVALIKKMKELESLVTSGGSLRPINLGESISDLINKYDGILAINGDATVIADEGLTSVFDNLISNAIKHGNASDVTLDIMNKGEYCEIIVADNGTGIPDEIKGDVFEEGFSGDEEYGSGLGLYIVKKTIERYGGYISLRDNEPSGTVFTIRLISVSDYSGIRSSLGVPVNSSIDGKVAPIAKSMGPVKSSAANPRTKSEVKVDTHYSNNTANQNSLGKTKLGQMKSSSLSPVQSGSQSQRANEIELNLLGLKCPQPILQLHSKTIKLPKGTIIRIKADCPTFERDLQLWAKKTEKTVLKCVREDNLWDAQIIV